MSQFLLDPLGFRLCGKPYWGFAGGDGTGDGGGGDGGGSDSDDPDDDDPEGKPETDPVKKLESTLSKVRQERKAVQDEYRPFKAALRELGISTPEALKEALTKGAGTSTKGGKPEEVDVEKVREAARAEVRQEAAREIALSRVEAMAKGMFQDPEDAVEHLRKNVDDLIGRDGKPDKNAIARELGDLLEAKPHWGSKKPGEVDFDGGARQTSSKPGSMDSFIREASRKKRGQ